MSGDSPDHRRQETEFERLDRNLVELMGELRVALPGVQVLFAFLLVAPFNQRFSTVSRFERDLYFATLLVTLLASTLLIAPTVLHRIEFRQRQKDWVVHTANSLTIAGMGVLAIALTCATALVTHFLLGQTTAIVTTVLVALTLAGFWFGMPLHRRRRHPG